ALATRHIERRGMRFLSGYTIGLVGCLLGLVLTLRADLPAGSVIVMCLAVIALLFAWLIEPAIRRGSVQP
ncbi:MAG: metal ABC transporter permease, partial [Gammaproteobacteria bacterium]|nr:metal ABC transporter permease [Gammaproteobacteria bacterium]